MSRAGSGLVPGSVAVAPAAPARRVAGGGLLADVMELVKIRLTFMVLITTFVGFLLGSGGSPDLWLLFAALLGTALVAASAQACNQVMEVDVDGLMERTRERPLPAGRMRRRMAVLVGAVCGAAGLGVLGIWVGEVPFLLAALTHGLYLAAYTPMKRRTPWCVWVGAIPGAVPPVIGWAAARDLWEPEAAILFGLLLLWQIPHFLAIAWMYRGDYERAGLKMLRAGDSDGRKAAAESLLFASLLAALSLGAFWALRLPPWYAVGAVLVNGWFLRMAFRFLGDRSREGARGLFLASIGYLPLALILLLCARGGWG